MADGVFIIDDAMKQAMATAIGGGGGLIWPVSKAPAMPPMHAANPVSGAPPIPYPAGVPGDALIEDDAENNPRFGAHFVRRYYDHRFAPFPIRHQAPASRSNQRRAISVRPCWTSAPSISG